MPDSSTFGPFDDQFPPRLVAEGREGDNAAPLSVGELSLKLKRMVEGEFGHVRLRGEISGFKRAASGHVYLALKDADAVIDGVIWRGAASALPFTPQDGIEVIATGKLTIYPGRSKYQIVIERMELAGEGALMALFERLKAGLAAEGLFDQGRKQKLPFMPKVIGVVTSPTGAVIRDIISVFRRRAPQVQLNLIPTAVQGREATAQIVRALQLADAQGFDALILARGGGSLEDLWCFNEEAVARAVAACVTPIVSAVGHETDVSIADFVADVRAPTPSAAAELLAPDSSELVQRLHNLQRRLVLHMQGRLARERLRLEGVSRRLRHPGERLRQQAQRLDDLDMRLRRAFNQQLINQRERLARLDARLAAQHPGRNLALLRQRLDGLAARLPRAMQGQLRSQRQQLGALAAQLQIVSPLATLGRGYSILLDERGQAVRRAAQTRPGQRLKARLGEGELDVRVEDNHIQPATLSLLD